MKKFNTAGPSVAGMHFMINPLVRIDIEDIESLIEDQRYFVLHAPRQTGKTTCLLALMQHLNAQTTYRTLYVNIEAAQAARGNVAEGMAAIVRALASAASLHWGDEAASQVASQMLQTTGPTDWVRSVLEQWSRSSPRPIVLLLDEVDALVGDTLISLLRQIRAGYAQRPSAFPQTIILSGVRDVRDYRMHTAHHEIITGGSAFNIKAKSLRLGNLSREETTALWLQHEAETCQRFDPAIWPELWTDTEGQPWLVNALGHECTWEDKSARDRSTPITLEHYKAARERLIYSRTTHLDALSDKLREPRVNRIMAAMLSGEATTEHFPEDDLQYIEDLGLIRLRPELTIANRIYREVLPREITFPIQAVLHYTQSWYVTHQRQLDMPKLLAAFQQFFREHSDAWIDGFSFKEAGPQLLMQAFLQRIVNGGGRINREYGLGRKRTDLFIEWPIDEAQGYFGPVQRVVLELKLWKKGSLDAVLAVGLPQTVDYARRCGADEAHLIVFDRRPDSPWDDRIWQREASEQGWALGVWGA
ncbi:MAG: ATP-binding protein [Hydrogenophaga sp.]|uniref:ATP-binding protein n=1 Tax=Hydrogenophaga sp. TaxID=1904254 RepID=UPI00276DF0A5|nr:ATP-binding protein [Hydrogenophaga sp.]MDP2419384.1 ATP-binding protein [Hydrogenophaga sp.]MDZ4189357.1 ATP-binding protein [Hydrogenophaga sp.]